MVMGRTIAAVRKLSPNIKLIWLMPQIILITSFWFIGATFGLFIAHDIAESIIPGMHNTIAILLILLGSSGIIFVPSYLLVEMEYNEFTYQLEDSGILIRWGVINRHRTVVPYEKIQDIKTDRTAFERIFGLVTLKLETAGRSGLLSETAVINGISINERDELISDIMANVVVKRGEEPEIGNRKYDSTLVNILTELKDISVGLREEVQELKKTINQERKVHKSKK